MVKIRPEEPRDWPAVHAVNESAFETSAEADLVTALRTQAAPLVSLVAEDARTTNAAPTQNQPATVHLVQSTFR